jgi:competence protein ComEC
MTVSNPSENATEPRSFVGRIESVERHLDSPRRRHTIIIDAVDTLVSVDEVDQPFEYWNRENLALLRIVTTAEKFALLAGMEDPNDENGNENLAGRWMELQLVPRGTLSGPLAQVCRLGERGYDRLELFTVSEITDFGFDPKEPKSVGAAANTSKVLAARLKHRRTRRKIVASTSVSGHALVSLYSRVANAAISSVIVHDVGHANFISALDGAGAPILHFDCGWPIPWNWKTYPPMAPSGPYAGFVILSHWDSDHFSGFHRWPAVQNAIWLVPDQELGPNAEFVFEALMNASRLIMSPLLPNDDFTVGGVTIIGCDPTLVKGKSKEMNNSGMAMSISLEAKRNVLLPGDADYKAIKNSLYPDPDCLVVSHHGARVEGPIPFAPTDSSRAIVSQGLNNCYKHPSIESLNDHSAAGWALEFTSELPSGVCGHQASRGDRRFS